MQPINTVVVIEVADGTIVGIWTWPDSPGGNAAAEKVFTACYNENSTPMDREDTPLGDALENGHAFFPDHYDLFIIHSAGWVLPKNH